MAATDVVQVISHYQRDIEKICSRPERALKHEDRLLYCINKLHKLPVTVNHLQLTGVGKTVNALRKLQGKKGINEAAKTLVAKWKAMVIEEDEQAENLEKAQTSTDDDETKAKVPKYTPNAWEYIPSKSADERNCRPPSPNSDKNAYTPRSLSHHSQSSYTPSMNSPEPNGYSPSSSQCNGSEVYRYSPSKRSEPCSENMEYSPSKISQSSHESKKKTNEKHSKSRDSKHKSRHSKEDSRHGKESSRSSHSSSSRHKGEESTSNSSSHHSNSVKSSKVSSNGKSSHSHTKIDSSSSKSSEVSKNSQSAHKSTNDEKKSETRAKSLEQQSGAGASFAAALGPMIVKKGSTHSKKKSRPESFEPTPSTSRSTANRIDLGSPKKHNALPVEQLLDDVAGPSHLSPLDAGLLSTLSVPNPNYRPMPHPPMLDKKIRIQAEEDALTRIMSNKNSRTKVYSGVRGGLSYVPSLYECCCRILQVHIDSLEFTGGIPYNLLKPVLDGATPSQLYQFEHYNPYVIGDTDHLWKFHVNKDFRNIKREEMESWRDMYLRCMDEREEKYKAVTANIQESLKKSVPVRQTKLAYVDITPKHIMKKQVRNGISKPDANKLLGKNNPDAVAVRPPPRIGAPSRDIRDVSFYKPKPKMAPLMQKTLKSIKQTRFKR